MSIKVTDYLTAAKAALSRMVLQRNSGYQSADREDCMQEAAFAAARAGTKFDDKGLTETKTGRAGYMTLSANRAGLDFIRKSRRIKGREVVADFSEGTFDSMTTSFGRVEAIERRALIAAVLKEVDSVVGGDHAFLARSLLDHRSEAHDIGCPVKFVAATLRKTPTEINRMVDELAAFFSQRSVQYLGV